MKKLKEWKEIWKVEKYFNNYSLSNEEIEKIIMDYRPVIRKAAKIDGKLDEECEQKIMIAIYQKLSKNR